MPEDTPTRWKFLTNHAQVLVSIAHDPEIRLREISERVGITERAAHKIVDDLVRDEYIERERNGRRNRYTIQAGTPLPERLGRVERIGDLLAVLTVTNGAGPKKRRTRAAPRVKAGA
jgi:predicted transcriptional regulator